jgi:hypothetical protein
MATGIKPDQEQDNCRCEQDPRQNHYWLEINCHLPVLLVTAQQRRQAKPHSRSDEVGYQESGQRMGEKP